VPVGTCLSGGLDSSIIAALIHETIRDAESCEDETSLGTRWSQHTFTATLPGSPLDESRYAKSVVDALGDLKYHGVEPTAAQLLQDIERLVWHQEQPFGSPSIYMQWAVMKAAQAEGVRVLLDGQGGDEIFCGYEGYVPPLIAQLLLRGRWARAFAEWRGAVRHRFFTRRALAAHVGAQLLPESMRDRLRAGNLRATVPWISGDLFVEGPGPDISSGLGLGGDAPREDYSRYGRARRFFFRQLTAESLPSLLRFEDRNAMAFSIEARVPYLDRRLVRLAMSMRPEEKIRRGELKAALREALGDRVPRDVRDRRDKIGFTAPTAEWLRGDLRPWWTEALTSKSFLQRGCFAPKGVLATIRRFDAGDDGAATAVWRMAITEQWARQFLDRPAPSCTEPRP
jgi:asparagine synthase (glutamine-hydrolysing)